MSINLCVFSGNLGGDCEQKYTPSGNCIANFSLPVKQGYGEHEKTSWVRCVLLGKKAESLPQYLTKGAKVTVTGEFVLNEWTDQQGQKRSTPELVVRDLELPPKPQGGGNYQQPQQQPQQQAPQQPQQQYHAPQQNAYQQAQSGHVPQQGGQPAMSQGNPYQNQQQQAPQQQVPVDDFKDKIPF